MDVKFKANGKSSKSKKKQTTWLDTISDIQAKTTNNNKQREQDYYGERNEYSLFAGLSSAQNLNELPAEILLLIFTFLNGPDLIAVSLTSRLWRELSEDPYLNNIRSNANLQDKTLKRFGPTQLAETLRQFRFNKKAVEQILGFIHKSLSPKRDDLLAIVLQYLSDAAFVSTFAFIHDIYVNQPFVLKKHFFTLRYWQDICNSLRTVITNAENGTPISPDVNPSRAKVPSFRLDSSDESFFSQLGGGVRKLLPEDEESNRRLEMRKQRETFRSFRRRFCIETAQAMIEQHHQLVFLEHNRIRVSSCVFVNKKLYTEEYSTPEVVYIDKIECYNLLPKNYINQINRSSDPYIKILARRNGLVKSKDENSGVLVWRNMSKRRNLNPVWDYTENERKREEGKIEFKKALEKGGLETGRKEDSVLTMKVVNSSFGKEPTLGRCRLNLRLLWAAQKSLKWESVKLTLKLEPNECGFISVTVSFPPERPRHLLENSQSK